MKISIFKRVTNLIKFRFENIKANFYYYLHNKLVNVSYEKNNVNKILNRINIKYLLKINIKDKEIFFINSYFSDTDEILKYNLVKDIKSLKNNLEIYFPNGSKFPALPLCYRDVYASDITGGGIAIKYLYQVKIYLVLKNIIFIGC